MLGGLIGMVLAGVAHGLGWDKGQHDQFEEFSQIDDRSGATTREAEFVDMPKNGMPIKGEPGGYGRIQRFDKYGHPVYHNANDIPTPVGTKVGATHDGVAWAVDAGKKGYGLHVYVKNKDYISIYAHLSEVRVPFGANNAILVLRGQVIGLTGNTGFSTGPHLHYEIFSVALGTRFNPLAPAWFNKPLR